MTERIDRIDFKLLDNTNTMPAERRQSMPQIRYAFYNKGFEVIAINRKFSLGPRPKMPNIDEYAASPEDTDDSDKSHKWNKARSADAIHLFNLNKTEYGGSSGRDITRLPRLKIRINDEMGARVPCSFDESSMSSDDSNEFGKSFEERFAAYDDRRCEHATASDTVDDGTTSDPFQQIEENFRRRICKKCGHRKLCKQFTNSFQID